MRKYVVQASKNGETKAFEYEAENKNVAKMCLELSGYNVSYIKLDWIHLLKSTRKYVVGASIVLLVFAILFSIGKPHFIQTVAEYFVVLFFYFVGGYGFAFLAIYVGCKINDVVRWSWVGFVIGMVFFIGCIVLLGLTVMTIPGVNIRFEEFIKE